MNILISSLIAGLLTGAGALITVNFKKINNKAIALSLGFAGGVMIGVSIFHLIPESINVVKRIYCIIGLLIGFLFMHILEKLVPHHTEDINKNNQNDKYLKMGYLIALGIAIHNLPEGLAIGASSGISEKTGIMMAVLIGLHNIVEGLAVSIPLHLGKVKKTKTILITTLTGLSTLLGAAIGLYLINISNKFISISMSFAAGAMIYIAILELIPQSYKENNNLSVLGIIAGAILSLLL